MSRESDSGAEALIRVLESDADATVVVGADGQLTGVVTLREFTLSPVAADMALHQRLRRAPTVADVVPLANQAPKTLRRLLKRGLASGKVIAVHSSLIDTMIRRIIDLEFAASPSWRWIGSPGWRWAATAAREAVPSSDIDSAVAFADGMGEEEMDAYRAVFTRVDLDLAAAGLRATPTKSAAGTSCCPTDAQWREAARGWLVDPVGDKGAIMAPSCSSTPARWSARWPPPRPTSCSAICGSTRAQCACCLRMPWPGGRRLRSFPGDRRGARRPATTSRVRRCYPWSTSPGGALSGAQPRTRHDRATAGGRRHRVLACGAGGLARGGVRGATAAAAALSADATARRAAHLG